MKNNGATKRSNATIWRLVICSLLVCHVMQSCNDFLEVDSRHAASETQQWETLEDTRSALMGVYGLMRAAIADNNTHWICGDLRMGDFTVYKRNDLQAVADNELNQPYDLLKNVSDWRRFYAVINAAAVFIEKAPRTVELDRSYSGQNLKYDIAQVRALRAFAYFYMARIWGDVPLITYSYDNGSFPSVPRTDVQTVLNYAKSELLAVAEDLPYQYGTSTNLYYGSYGSTWQGILFNKLSAYGVLAHIYAWQGNYAEVETYSAFIIEHAGDVGANYTAITDLTSETGLFYSNSSIKGARILGFNFAHGDNEATQSGHLEQLTLAYPIVQKQYPEIYVSKDSLFSIFTNFDDLRFGMTGTTEYTTYYVQNAGADIPVFSKIKVVQDGAAKDNDFAVFGSSIVFTRLEEITLLRAEALCALNRSTEAITYLNDVRTTRGMNLLSLKSLGYSRERLTEEIFAERRRELMGEGWRWYDLVRRQKLLKDNGTLLQLISNGGIYWPVSEDIITANAQIEQNEYWK